MTFGKHKGTPIMEVPPAYLKWILDKFDDHEGPWAEWAQEELEDRYDDPSHPMYEPED